MRATCSRPGAGPRAQQDAGGAAVLEEFREFFPGKRGGLLHVSYYDYYQPEAYIASAGHLHRKGFAAINDEIERLRHSATAARCAKAPGRDRRRVRVSCIYGSGRPGATIRRHVGISLRAGMEIRPGRAFKAQLAEIPLRAQRPRTSSAVRLPRARRGTLEVYARGLVKSLAGPSASSSSATRSTAFREVDRRHAGRAGAPSEPRHAIFPASHYVTHRATTMARGICRRSRHEMWTSACSVFEADDTPASRRSASAQRTRVRSWRCCSEIGFCSGIENYSRATSPAASPGRPRRRRCWTTSPTGLSCCSSTRAHVTRAAGARHVSTATHARKSEPGRLRLSPAVGV